MRGRAVPPTCRARVRTRAAWGFAVPLAVLLVVGAAAATGAQGLAPLAGITSSFGAALLFTLLVGGWVGEELRSGAALFWIQTPHRPVALYAARFAGVAAMAGILALTLPAAAAGLLFAFGRGTAATEVLLRVPALGLTLGILAALVWTTGGWGIRGDGWAGALAGLGLAGLELGARLRPDALGVAAGPADLLGLPLDDLASAASLLAGTGGDGAALARVLAWITAWGVLGAAGVRRTAGRVWAADTSA